VSAILSNSNTHTVDFGFAYYSSVLAPWYETRKEVVNEQGYYVNAITHCGVLSWIVRANAARRMEKLVGSSLTLHVMLFTWSTKSLHQGDL